MSETRAVTGNVPESVKKFREKFRKAHPSSLLGDAMLLTFSFGFSAILIFVSLSRLSEVRPWEWLIIPVTFIYANMIEYIAHRGPMHHRTRLGEIAFTKHTAEHHFFYTAEAMDYERPGDLYKILFSPPVTLLFVGLFGLPVALMIGWLLGSNSAYLFFATAIAYYFNYECLHLIYHLPRRWWICRLPGLRFLRRLHTHHHDTRLMSRYNFNITYPIFDWVFGTLYRGEPYRGKAQTRKGIRAKDRLR